MNYIEILHPIFPSILYLLHTWFPLWTEAPDRRKHVFIDKNCFYKMFVNLHCYIGFSSLKNPDHSVKWSISTVITKTSVNQRRFIYVDVKIYILYFTRKIITLISCYHLRGNYVVWNQLKSPCCPPLAVTSCSKRRTSKEIPAHLSFSL